PEVLPYGFGPLAVPVNRSNIPAPKYVTTRYYTPAGSSTPIANSRVFYGFDYLDETNISYLNALPSGSTSNVGATADGGVDEGFDLLTDLEANDAVDIDPI